MSTERKIYSYEDLNLLIQEGLNSGPRKFASMEEIKTEARRRFEQGKSSGLPLEPSRNKLINGNAHESASIDDKKQINALSPKCGKFGTLRQLNALSPQLINSSEFRNLCHHDPKSDVGAR